MSEKSEKSVLQTLKRYVETTFLVDLDNGDLSTSSNLFEAGVIDSYGVVELVSFIEAKLGVKLSDEELLSPELASVEGMAALIERKMVRRASEGEKNDLHTVRPS